MKRLVAALLIGVLPFAQSAQAEPSPAPRPSQEATVAAIQTMLADVGRWSLDYQGIISRAVDPLAQINAYLQILERYANGETEADRAAEEINAWRTTALAAVAAARAEAETLRPPPSLSEYGPRGVAMETAFNAARDGAVPMIHEIEQVVNNCAEVGLAALRDPGKAYDTRLRVLLQSQIQLIRVDLGRLDVTAAALPENHPMQALTQAMRHYYESIIALPIQVLQTPNGQEVNRAALVATLRQSSQDMRRELARASALTEQTRASMRAQLGGPGVEIARMAVAVFDTIPQSIAAFSGLAGNVDRGIAAIENGEELLQVWSDQETWDTPYLQEIERLDRLRASLLANNAGAL